jgi:hypothetical protein
MGICISSGGIDVTEEDKKKHRMAEKSLREVSYFSLTAIDSFNCLACFADSQAKAKMSSQVKVIVISHFYVL